MIRPGDVVYLRSGGLAMTVALTDDDRALCAWFNDKDRLETAWLGKDALTHADQDPGPWVRFCQWLEGF